MAKWLSFLGKFAISGSLCVVYTYAAELFPTEVRSIGIGFGSMVGRVGGVSAPFIILLEEIDGLSFLPYLIFGVSGILSGAWALFLPETAGEPILQTIDEALLFYAGKRNGVGDIQSDQISNLSQSEFRRTETDQSDTTEL